jgi:predicted Fe-Mo cluster-binding NifX family protein
MTIRIAVASNDGTKVDQHFGQAESFYIYDVSETGAIEIERREVAPSALPNEGIRETIIRILADCKMLLVEKVGPGPRPMLAKAGIEAIDQYAHKAVQPSLAAVYASHAG